MKIENGILSSAEESDIVDGVFTVQEGVTEIGNCVFWGCTSLTSVVIPDSVTKIGDCAFHDCVNLKRVTIPDSVTKIGNSAFYDCPAFDWYYFNDNFVTALKHKRFFEDCAKLGLTPEEIKKLKANEED